MAALQILLTGNVLMNRWFDTAPITELDWIKILSVSPIAYGVTEVEKYLQRVG